MLPSMRYHSAKLSQLVHQKKNYYLHMNSIDKIMTKSSQQFAKRDQRLRELKSRKEQAYHYSMYLRNKDIGHKNSILFSKIAPLLTQRELQHGGSFEELQEKIEEREAEMQKEQEAAEQRVNNFVLRNHRQSPVHKTTQQQRVRQNVRLARKIIDPVVTYKTQNYQKMHENTRKLKDRIRRYGQDPHQTKAEFYVDRKLSQSLALSQRGSSLLARTSFSMNPESLKAKETELPK